MSSAISRIVVRSEPAGGTSARRVSLGSESSETWSPPVAVGFVLKRRRRICWGRLIWPSGAVSAASKAASWSLVVFWTSSWRASRAMMELMKSAVMGGAASGVGVGSTPGAPKAASS